MQIRKEIALAPDKSGPRQWFFCFNHAALLALERLSGRPAWAVLVEEQETVTRLVQLAYAASESHRHHTRTEVSFERFQEGWLPPYLSDEWFAFQDSINALIAETFPRAAGTRMELQTLTAAMMMSSLANTAELIGTSGSTAPNVGSE